MQIYDTKSTFFCKKHRKTLHISTIVTSARPKRVPSEVTVALSCKLQDFFRKTPIMHAKLIFFRKKLVYLKNLL